MELLSKYKVLYLADICYLTDKTAGKHHKICRNGGGLVMTYATSLYDEHGEKAPICPRQYCKDTIP